MNRRYAFSAIPLVRDSKIPSQKATKGRSRKRASKKSTSGKNGGTLKEGLAKEGQEKRGPGESFSFLELPAELRNNVYEKVLEIHPEGFLTTRSKNSLATRSALVRVNRQVREEFQHVLFLRSDICTTVINFNFGPLIKFLNGLSDVEIKSLVPKTDGRKTARKVEIELRFNRGGWANSKMTVVRALRRWINRLGHPTKKGTNLDIIYRVVEKSGYFPWLLNIVLGRLRMPEIDHTDNHVKDIARAMRRA